MATATARWRRAIEHLVATDLARARLARAAFDAVIDGLDLGPTAIRTAADRQWVQLAIAGPIQRAADEALRHLVEDLIETLRPADPEVVARMLGHAPDLEPDDPAARDVSWELAGGAERARGASARRPLTAARAPDERVASTARVAVLR
jgi:hypothetical protein